jgi:uroporphyrinogen-III synthase
MTTKMPLANIGVAITRPIDQAIKLTQLVETAGGHVIPFPLIEISALNDYSAFEQLIATIDQYDWAIFISSNAVQNGMPHLLKQGIPDSLQFAAIGPVTAKELQDYGIQHVLIPDGDRFDSESLLSMPEMQDMQGKKIIIIRGIGGRDVLANALKARGAEVTFGECYQRINPQTNCVALAQATAKRQLHCIVVTSSEAMRHLMDLAGETDWLKQVTLCVNHARVAELPLQKGLKVKVADIPGDDGMMSVLQHLH